MDEAEEVLDVVFPAHDEAAELVHPGEQPFYFPAAAVAPQRAPILGFAAPPPFGAISSMSYSSASFLSSTSES